MPAVFQVRLVSVFIRIDLLRIFVRRLNSERIREASRNRFDAVTGR